MEFLAAEEIVGSAVGTGRKVWRGRLYKTEDFHETKQLITKNS